MNQDRDTWRRYVSSLYGPS